MNDTPPPRLHDPAQVEARILIVDDEPANLKLLDKMLRAEGYTNLVLIQDPRQVLEAYRQAPVDLILLDINMPYLDGFAVLAGLQAPGEPLLPPVIILTAQHGRDILLRALNSGARDFIGKPFDRLELLARVRNLLDVHLAQRLLHARKEELEAEVRARTEELHRTRLQVVRRLGRAAEYRDNETGYHIMRVSHVATLLARAAGWDEAACDLMLNASPMHDIGKIGIPDRILLKPGRLEPEEMEVMKTHTTIGAEILGDDDSDLLRLAREIALTHHEKWDGTGYPQGLAGADIPQSGRIVAVADVFDALTSERVYKRAWPVEDAVAYMREQAGAHFDPELVGHFLDLLPQVLEIRTRFAEPTAEPA